jgi:cell division protein FtsB
MTAAARSSAPAAADDVDLPKLPPRRQQNPWMRRLLLGTTCVLMLDALFGERGLAETMKARRDFQDTSAGLAEVRQQNAALRAQIRHLQEDPGTIESVAREELGLIRPGEILVIVKNVK